MTPSNSQVTVPTILVAEDDQQIQLIVEEALATVHPDRRRLRPATKNSDFAPAIPLCQGFCLPREPDEPHSTFPTAALSGSKIGRLRGLGTHPWATGPRPLP